MKQKTVWLLILLTSLFSQTLWMDEKQAPAKKETSSLSAELQVKIKGLIKQLGDNEFKTRAKARDDIGKIMDEVGIEKIEPLLKESLSSTEDPEVKASLNYLLQLPEKRFEELNYPERQGWQEMGAGKEITTAKPGYFEKDTEQKFEIFRKYRAYKYKYKPGILDIPGKDIVDYRGNAFPAHKLSTEKFSAILKDENIKISDFKTAEKAVITYFEMLDLNTPTYAGKTPEIKAIKKEESKNEYNFKVSALTFITSAAVEEAEWEFTITKNNNEFLGKRIKIIQSFDIGYD